MDEKGFLISIMLKQKRIFSKRKYYKDRIKQMIQDRNQEWITLIACVCADRTALSPGLIYQAGKAGIQDSWLQDFNPALHKAYFNSSPTR